MFLSAVSGKKKKTFYCVKLPINGVEQAAIRDDFCRANYVNEEILGMLMSRWH